MEWVKTFKIIIIDAGDMMMIIMTKIPIVTNNFFFSYF